MQKHLLHYPWIFAAMIAGILACITLLLCMLLSNNAAPEVPSSGVILVKEAMRHAAF